MTPIKGGVFLMGSPDTEAGRNAYEGPQHEVEIKPFRIAAHETTNAQWKLCVDDGACAAKRDGAPDMPVLSVSWREANAYIDWLSGKTQRKYRLPTEAEWEYAARGGSQTAYWWGERFDAARAPSALSAVGSGDPNAFGLFDVAGNAREWTADCYVNNFTATPRDGSAASSGDCGRRVIRGGAWSSSPADKRTANRSRIEVDGKPGYMGFRVAAEAP
jgi:formylglycine-generating enzyme required for sulfatase activity